MRIGKANWLLVFLFFFSVSAMAAENDLRFILDDFEGNYHNENGYGEVPEGWVPGGSQNGEFSRVTDSHHGSYALHAYVTNDPDQYTGIKKTFSMQPGEQINIRIQARASTTHQAEGVLDATYSANGTTHYFRHESFWYSYSSPEWRTITLKNYIVPPSGEVAIYIMVHHNNQNGYSDIYWDCLSYDFVTEISVFPMDYIITKLIRIGESVVQSFSIDNKGSGDLVIGSLSITGANADEFEIENDNCSGNMLTPSETCKFDLVFAPLTGGEKKAELSIPSNDLENSPLTVPLEATAGGIAISGIIMMLLEKE